MRLIFKFSFIYFCIFILILFFVFRSLIFNLSTNLYSWLDFPYVIWLIYQGIGKISSFNLANFGATNAFYPIRDSYFFSDLFLPQALIAFPISRLFNNPILVVNIVLIFTFILNYISLYFFWSICFKRSWQRFIASIAFIFSPFFHLQFGHFQMMSYWPLFFSLYFFCKSESYKLKNILLSGIFLVIQFLSSVYLSVFLIFSLCLKTLLNTIKIGNIRKIKDLLVVLLVFLIGAGYFIYGYVQVKKHYSFVRDYGEYVTYSAHISDYIFTTGVNSLFNKTSMVEKWNSFNKHIWGERATFPGFVVSISILLYLIKVTYRKKTLKIELNLDNDDLFFLLLLIFGVLFSIGPRINFNGVYSGIPTPYTFLIKYVPFFDSIRSLARWSFLFYFSLSYFFTKYLSNKKMLFVLFFAIIFALENFPLSLVSTKENYIDPNSDYILKNYCSKEKAVLLEIPMNHLMVGTGIIEGLNYISKRQLSSVYTECFLVNGYSGYEPPELTKFYNDVDEAIIDENKNLFIDLLKSRNVFLIRITDNLIVSEKRDKYFEAFNVFLSSGRILKLTDGLFILN